MSPSSSVMRRGKKSFCILVAFVFAICKKESEYVVEFKEN